MVTVPLHKMSAPCSNALHCPFPHVQHCPHRHGRINLHNLPDDVGLQLVEGGRIWIWGSPIGRSRGGRKWQTLDMDGTHSTFMEELFKFMEEHSIFMEGHSKVTPKSRQQSVSTHYQAFFLHLDSLLHKDLSKIPYGFLTNQGYICHSWFWLNSLFFETPCSTLGQNHLGQRWRSFIFLGPHNIFFRQKSGFLNNLSLEHMVSKKSQWLSWDR